MSLVPFLFNDQCLSARPSRIINQEFGMGLDFHDMISPMYPPDFLRVPSPYRRTWEAGYTNRDSGSIVVKDKDEFQVNLDVQHFVPREITVKVFDSENTVMIEGKHEEKQDEHGTIYRHFVRKYNIPEGYDMSKIVSKLSTDGVLSICAPRLVNNEAADYKIIPIQQTGLPSNPIQNIGRTEENVVEK